MKKYIYLLFCKFGRFRVLVKKLTVNKRSSLGIKCTEVFFEIDNWPCSQIFDLPATNTLPYYVVAVLRILKKL